MFASIILVTSLCTVGPENADRCDVKFDHVWTNTSIVQTVESFKADGIECLKMLDAYPDIETIDKDHYKTTSCYTVDYQTKPGYGILTSMTDEDDSFIRHEKDLEVE